MKPQKRMLETFPNPHLNNSYEIILSFDEFTSLCPKTGQPDFATIQINYTPDQKCVETKSLKLYLFSFRQCGAFMEDIVNKILNDLVATLLPKSIFIQGKFAVRGGIALNVNAQWKSSSY